MTAACYYIAVIVTEQHLCNYYSIVFNVIGHGKCFYRSIWDPDGLDGASWLAES